VDNSSKLLPLLEQGIGYSFLPYKMVKEQIKAGVFEEVKLKDFAPPSINTYLIYRQTYDASIFLENKF
jgi:DNA-binding transcriptional LysR family regulator